MLLALAPRAAIRRATGAIIRKFPRVVQRTRANGGVWLGGAAAHVSPDKLQSRQEGTTTVSGVREINLSVRRIGQGVIWVNSSHENGRFVREAEKSALTARPYMDDADFVLVSDKLHENLDPVFDFQAKASFFVPASLTNKTHFNGQMAAKLAVLKQMTWEKNLYLGSDIVVLRPGIQDILGLLDHFDIVVAHAPVRVNENVADKKLARLPLCYPEMNCDLIAYKRSPAMGEFMAEWERVYTNNWINHAHDQGAFRYLLLHSGLRLYVLPPEYNYRGYEYSPDAFILQRREALHLYMEHYPTIAEVYGP